MRNRKSSPELVAEAVKTSLHESKLAGTDLVWHGFVRTLQRRTVLIAAYRRGSEKLLLIAPAKQFGPITYLSYQVHLASSKDASEDDNNYMSLIRLCQEVYGSAPILYRLHSHDALRVYFRHETRRMRGEMLTTMRQINREKQVAQEDRPKLTTNSDHNSS